MSAATGQALALSDTFRFAMLTKFERLESDHSDDINVDAHLRAIIIEPVFSALGGELANNTNDRVRLLHKRFKQ